MNRLTNITRFLSETAHELVERVPQLGADFTFEQGQTTSVTESPDPIVRNRWARTDLVSAIGKDPHDADTTAITWPPAAQRC